MDDIVIGDAPPDVDLPVLVDGIAMSLPDGAELNPDGSVRLPLLYPCELKYRAVGGSGDVVRTESIDHLVLRRLTGAEARRVIEAKDSVRMALAISSGLGPAKLEMLSKVLDAADETMAADVVSELLGLSKRTLPELARDLGDCVELTLRFARTDADGQVHSTWTFKRLTAAQRRAAGDAADLLTWVAQHATGLNPKKARDLVDSMDGVDVMAASQVVGFLSGSGRRSGG